ncbi:MAG: hypothetical protein F4Z53_00580 [Acidimicrobiales bacterium]|nr:hypothetical protein [Acidimicrobiales bacterium]MYD32978.1 hypothetical protein [Acidimicrobiales bacterium]MYI08531.1 hypothetical protein [Acidimicrobiales bacterium]
MSHTSRRRRSPRSVVLAACVAAVLTVSCGGSVADAPDPAAGAEAAQTPAVGAPDPAALRVRTGVSAAGGDLNALGGADRCTADNTSVVGYVGPDLAKLDAIGLETLVIEEPSIVIDTYLQAINDSGGLHGRCFITAVHQWDPADPVGSVERICADLSAQTPLFTINFLGDVAAIECLTLDDTVPTLGLYASAPSELLVLADGRLFVDDGIHAYLLENSLEVTLQTQYLSPDAHLGFLRGAGSAIDDQIAVTRALMADGGLFSLIDEYGIDVNSVAPIPPAFSDLRTLMPARQAGLLRADLTEAQRAAAEQYLAGLADDEVELLQRIETFYLEAAMDYRDAGVQVIVSTAPWYELRRLMRAAELIDWQPWWLTSDIQGATLTLTDAPAEQARKFLLVSARRAAGDEVPHSDRGCAALRNTSQAAPAFSHRHHTDAWSVLTATCDLLDIAVAAMSRMSPPLTGESFVAAMRQTSHEFAFGGRATYSLEAPDSDVDAAASSGADRFRVLEADPECILDEWGCMRALTDWLAPVADAKDVDADG